MSKLDDASRQGVLALRDLLQARPPGSSIEKERVFGQTDNGGFGEMYSPTLQLYCGACKNQQNFAAIYGTKRFHWTPQQPVNRGILTFSCRNCGGRQRHFAVQVDCHDGGRGSVHKFGERPAFGPPLPTRMYRLLGEHQEILDKGYRLEKDGLGIGAFAYYRRIIELSKNRLLEEIGKALDDGDVATAEIREALEAAKGERQFSAALRTLRLPPQLLVLGENPLQLLHDVTSIGLHGLSDAECLTFATETREILFAMASRIAEARKEQQTLREAVQHLRQVRTKES